MDFYMYTLLIQEAKGHFIIIMYTSILITLPTSSKLQKITVVCILCYFAAWLVHHDSGVHFLIPGVAFLFDCRLNDSNVSVELHVQKPRESSFHRVDPQEDKFVIKQTGQNFTIRVTNKAKGQIKFQCRTAGQTITPVLKKEVRIQKVLGLKQQ